MGKLKEFGRDDITTTLCTVRTFVPTSVVLGSDLLLALISPSLLSASSRSVSLGIMTLYELDLNGQLFVKRVSNSEWWLVGSRVELGVVSFSSNDDNHTHQGQIEILGTDKPEDVTINGSLGFHVDGWINGTQENSSRCGWSSSNSSRSSSSRIVGLYFSHNPLFQARNLVQPSTIAQPTSPALRFFSIFWHSLVGTFQNRSRDGRFFLFFAFLVLWQAQVHEETPLRARGSFYRTPPGGHLIAKPTRRSTKSVMTISKGILTSLYCVRHW